MYAVLSPMAGEALIPMLGTRVQRITPAEIRVAGGGGSSRFDPIDTTQYSKEETCAAVEAAADWGTYVAAHVFNDRAVNRLLDCGVKTFEHAFFISEKTMRRIAKSGGYVVPLVVLGILVPVELPDFCEQKGKGIAQAADQVENVHELPAFAVLFVFDMGGREEIWRLYGLDVDGINLKSGRVKSSSCQCATHCDAVNNSSVIGGESIKSWHCLSSGAVIYNGSWTWLSGLVELKEDITLWSSAGGRVVNVKYFKIGIEW